MEEGSHSKRNQTGDHSWHEISQDEKARGLQWNSYQLSLPSWVWRSRDPCSQNTDAEYMRNSLLEEGPGKTTWEQTWCLQIHSWLLPNSNYRSAKRSTCQVSDPTNSYLMFLFPMATNLQSRVLAIVSLLLWWPHARPSLVCSPPAPCIFRQRIIEQQKCSRAVWARWCLLGSFICFTRLGSSTDLVISPAVLHCPAPGTMLFMRPGVMQMFFAGAEIEVTGRSRLICKRREERH